MLELMLELVHGFAQRGNCLLVLLVADVQLRLQALDLVDLVAVVKGLVRFHIRDRLNGGRTRCWDIARQGAGVLQASLEPVHLAEVERRNFRRLVDIEAANFTVVAKNQDFAQVAYLAR